MNQTLYDMLLESIVHLGASEVASADDLQAVCALSGATVDDLFSTHRQVAGYETQVLNGTNLRRVCERLCRDDGKTPVAEKEPEETNRSDEPELADLVSEEHLELLRKGDIETLAALDAYLAEHKDLTGIKGIGSVTHADIVASTGRNG